MSIFLISKPINYLGKVDNNLIAIQYALAEI